MSDCVRGCPAPHRRRGECGTNDCRGCEPAQARYGRLCWNCHRRLELMLVDAPTVVDWLNAHLPRGTARPAKNDAELRRASGDQPLPLDLGVLDLVDTWEQALTGWVDSLCESTQPPLTGPAEHDPRTCAGFLLTWLSTVEDRDWTEDLWVELADLTRDSHALAPWRPTMRRVDGVPCPRCNQCSLVVFGGESDVTCLECRETVPEHRYGIWVRIAAEEAAS